jgi:hypothetical protein
MGVNNYQGDYNIFHNDNAIRAITVAYTDEFSLSQIDSGAWTTYSGQDAHSLVVYSDTVLFVNPTTYDLHLLSTSPAIDKGSNASAPSEDYDGIPRPQGSGYDIGAYEYSSSPITTTAGSTTTSCIEGDLCCIELTYGAHSEETERLRYLRDNVLNQTPEGREIVRLYYQWSPAIVKAMENDEEFKQEVTGMIDELLMIIR